MHVNRQGTTIEIESEQRSGDVQFEAIPIGLPDGAPTVYAGYRRCSDFDAGNNAGQDYLAVRADEQTIVGVVADGVGQSFYGDLAGCRVAKFLLDFLWSHRAIPPSDNDLAEALLAEAKAFQADVDALVIPTHLAPMLQEALANTRTKGSQAVFAAFVLDLNSAEVFLYQVGDVDVYLVSQDGTVQSVRAPKRGRWSSGGKTDLLLRTERHQGITALIAQTDGATDTWASGLRWSDDLQQQFAALAAVRASVDDVSFVGVGRIPFPQIRSAAGPVIPAPAEPVIPAPAEPVKTVVSEKSEPRPRRQPVRLPLGLLAAIFGAGVVTGLLMMCAAWRAGTSSPKSSSSATATTATTATTPPSQPIAPSPPAVLQVTTTGHPVIRGRLGAEHPTVVPTKPGEVSIWTTVPGSIGAATLRLTVSLPSVSVVEGQPVFHLVLARLPMDSQHNAVAEVVDASGHVVARGSLQASARGEGPDPANRGYYFLEPVPAK